MTNHKTTGCSLRVVSARLQRGAASIIIVVLLATVVMTVLLLTLRQSNTELLDAHRQSDTTAALYLAESGLERTAYRFQSTVCTSLVETAGSLGAGTYETVSAVVDGSNCIVQVKGTVNQSVRTIEAALIPANSSVDAWAVGNNGVVMQRSAGVWSLVTSGTSQNINGITCTSSTDCWAVGQNGVTLRWLGSTWVPSILTSAEDYTAIACAPANSSYCFLAGKGSTDGMTRFWNGSNWATEVAAGKELTAVDCPGTICYAVGMEGYVQRYNGSVWSVEANNVSEAIFDVTCFDNNNCWGATKSKNNNFVFANRASGSPWGEILVPSSSKKDLNSVSCSSSSACWAVGKNGRAVRYSGGSWSYYGALSSQELTAIQCRQSDGNCIAVAKNGQVFYWNGSTWAAETSATPHRLNSVYLFDTGGGTGTNVAIGRWIEVVYGS